MRSFLSAARCAPSSGLWLPLEECRTRACSHVVAVVGGRWERWYASWRFRVGRVAKRVSGSGTPLRERELSVTIKEV